MTSVDTRTGGRRRTWPWLAVVIPFGLGAFVPIYIGVRARRGAWLALGCLWMALFVIGAVFQAVDPHSDTAGGFYVFAWIGAAFESFAIRGEYERQMHSPLRAAERDAQARLEERRHASTIARQNPALAREMGLGRPDVPGANAEGLIDVNNAPARALATLPGVDDRLATTIIETRASINGFDSVEDMGAVLDLPAQLVEALKDLVIFLPRSATPAR
jgi:DNA uptake protein ComE-like DNA-binding protein